MLACCELRTMYSVVCVKLLKHFCQWLSKGSSMKLQTYVGSALTAIISLMIVSSIEAFIPSEDPPVCDNVGASGSVQSCWTPPAPPDPDQRYVTCDQLATNECESLPYGYISVTIKNDFPSSCTTQADKNCNQANSDCWASQACKVNESTYDCEPDAMNPPNTWNQVTKRKTVSCGGTTPTPP